MGHTKLTFSPALTALLDQKGPKLPPEAFIRALLDGAIKMEEVAFNVPDGHKMPVTPSQRTTLSGRHDDYAEVDRVMANIQNRGYVTGFVETLARLGSEAFDVLK
jgi:hypothetical protein